MLLWWARYQICTLRAAVKVTKGEEKGYFEFGGSTILLLLEKDKVKLCDDLLKNTREGFETKLLQGSVLGESLK